MCGCYHGSICGPGACVRGKNNCETTFRSLGRDHAGRVSTDERSAPGRSTDQRSWSGSQGVEWWVSDVEQGKTRRSGRLTRRTETGSGKGWQWEEGSACGKSCRTSIRIHVCGRTWWW